jgi:hypothetical protein
MIYERNWLTLLQLYYYYYLSPLFMPQGLIFFFFFSSFFYDFTLNIHRSPLANVVVHPSTAYLRASVSHAVFDLASYIHSKHVASRANFFRKRINTAPQENLRCVYLVEAEVKSLSEADPFRAFPQTQQAPPLRVYKRRTVSVSV